MFDGAATTPPRRIEHCSVLAIAAESSLRPYIMNSKMNNKIKAVMKKNTIALSVALAMFSVMPLSVQADGTIQPANVATAPAIPANTLHQLPWEPLVPPVKKTAT